MADTTHTTVTSDHLASDAYQRWRPEFAKALDPRRYTIEHVDGFVASGRYVLDATDDAAVLTEAVLYPTGNWEVHGVIAAGSLQEIRRTLIPRVEQRAMENGAVAASISSTAGWARVLGNDGYRVYQVTMSKPQHV